MILSILLTVATPNEFMCELVSYTNTLLEMCVYIHEYVYYTNTQANVRMYL